MGEYCRILSQTSSLFWHGTTASSSGQDSYCLSGMILDMWHFSMTYLGPRLKVYHTCSKYEDQSPSKVPKGYKTSSSWDSCCRIPTWKHIPCNCSHPQTYKTLRITMQGEKMKMNDIECIWWQTMNIKCHLDSWLTSMSIQVFVWLPSRKSLCGTQTNSFIHD